MRRQSRSGRHGWPRNARFTAAIKRAVLQTRCSSIRNSLDAPLLGQSGLKRTASNKPKARKKTKKRFSWPADIPRATCGGAVEAFRPARVRPDWRLTAGSSSKQNFCGGFFFGARRLRVAACSLTRWSKLSSTFLLPNEHRSRRRHRRS